MNDALQDKGMSQIPNYTVLSTLVFLLLFQVASYSFTEKLSQGKLTSKAVDWVAATKRLISARQAKTCFSRSEAQAWILKPEISSSNE